MHDAIDVGDLVHGFQQGKALKLQDWRMRKEQREFEKLVCRLKSFRRYHEVMSEGKDSPRYVLMRASANRARRWWWQRNKAKAAADRRERRIRKRKAAPVVIECAGGCGATWCPMPVGLNGKHTRYCSKACKNRARYQRAKARKNSTATTGQTTTTSGGVVRPENNRRAEEPPKYLTAGDSASAAGGMGRQLDPPAATYSWPDDGGKTPAPLEWIEGVGRRSKCAAQPSGDAGDPSRARVKAEAVTAGRDPHFVSPAPSRISSAQGECSAAAGFGGAFDGGSEC